MRIKKPPEPPVTVLVPGLIFQNRLEKQDINRLAVSCAKNAVQIIKLATEVKGLDPIKDSEQIMDLNKSIIIQSLVSEENVRNWGVTLRYDKKSDEKEEV